MILIPQFDSDGLLPAADYEVSFDELRHSVLVLGPVEPNEHSSWDARWRAQLVDNLEILTRQLAGWHPRYLRRWIVRGRQGPPQRYRRVFRLHFGPAENRRAGAQAKPAGRVQGLDLGPSLSQAVSGISEKTATHVAPLPRRIVSARAGARHRQRHA